jgi:hypothetical protein
MRTPLELACKKYMKNNSRKFLGIYNCNLPSAIPLISGLAHGWNRTCALLPIGSTVNGAKEKL